MAERKLFNVKLSEEEIAIIKERSDGKPISTYMRELALNQMPFASDSDELVTPSDSSAGLGLLLKYTEAEDELWDLLIKYFKTNSPKEMIEQMKNPATSMRKSRYSGWVVGVTSDDYPDSDGNCDTVVFLTNPKNGREEPVRVSEVEIEGLSVGDVIA